MSATYKLLPQGAHVMPPGAASVQTEIGDFQMPDVRRISAINVVGSLTNTVHFTIDPDSPGIRTLMRMACETQLERLARIRAWLSCDLRSRRRQKRICLALAQFAGFEDGEKIAMFLGSHHQAVPFIKRVLPGSEAGAVNGTAWLKPPPDVRLPAATRDAKRAEKIVPVDGASDVAVALLGALVSVLRDIVQYDLDILNAGSAAREAR